MQLRLNVSDAGGKVMILILKVFRKLLNSFNAISDEKNGQPTGKKYADLNKLSFTKGAKITNIFCQYK